MRLSFWPQDTIARRFAVTAVLAVGVTMVLIALFDTFGGSWSLDPLEQTGLLNEAGDVFRMIEAAPPALRPTLSTAAATRTFGVDWYDNASEICAQLKSLSKRNTGEVAQHISAISQHATVVFSGDRTSIPAGLLFNRANGHKPYILAMELNDHSWLAFTAFNRIWGLPLVDRWAIRVLFLALSITLVTAIASRQFLKPVLRLAEALRQFGNDPRGDPIDAAGPQEFRQVINTFNEMRAQIQTFVAHRTTMLAAISHDLRTPLTRIRLRGELIEDREQQARLFRDVDEMQAMVDGALAFFRDDAVAEPTTMLDLPHLIVTITNDYADQGVVIAYDGPVRGVYQGRPFALKRALTNLIENAIKYGTTPQIRLCREAISWNITIQDRGPGIPSEFLDSVFRPYHRVDKSRNRQTGGVGLGLTVAQAIIHGHGGKIVLTNREGGGLEARIMLPLNAASPIGITRAIA